MYYLTRLIEVGTNIQKYPCKCIFLHCPKLLHLHMINEPIKKTSIVFKCVVPLD